MGNAMILRRVIAHFRKQEWTAIFIDLVIVVFGVFIGIQVANWNEARHAQIAEAALLDRLETEFRAIEPDLAQWVEQMEATTASTAAVVDALRRDRPPENLLEFRRHLAQANFVRTVPAISANYVGLVSSGGIAAIEDEELRIALIRYGDAHAQAERFYPAALAAVFESQSNYYAAVEWSMNAADWEGDAALVGYDWQRLRASRAEMQAWITFQYELTQLGTRQLGEVRTILRRLENRRR
jgi:hypothetical protein